MADTATEQRTCACGCGQPVNPKARYVQGHNRYIHEKEPCGVDGCPEPHHARGYCKGHYQRFSYYGDPLAGKPGIDHNPRLPDSVTAATAARLAGLTYRQFDYWVSNHDPAAADLGFDQQNPGSGIDRQMPRLALPRWHVLGDLIRFGLKHTTALALDHQRRLRLRAVMAPYFRGQCGSQRRKAGER